MFLCSKEKDTSLRSAFFLQKNSVFSGTASFRQGWEEAQAKLERNVYWGEGLRKKCLLLDFVPITYQNVKLDLSNSFQVYDEIPTDLQKQMSNMEKHVEMYKDQYPLKVVPLNYRK